MENGVFEKAKFRIAGDRGLLVEYGEIIDPTVNLIVRSMATVLQHYQPKGVIEIIPAYRSLLVIYDPEMTTPVVLQEALVTMEECLPGYDIPPPMVIDIPVCYGGEYGPDIDYVAESQGLTVEEVIRIHSEPEYLIYMIGFGPGFPFLGELSESLHTPRLETPRTSVPAGSVGIANNQTGIYPITSPGGWRLIGRTPLRLFAPERKNPILYQSGNRIRFRSISFEEYNRLVPEEVE